MKNNRVLTGITTSGTPHLGNYAGAIRPAINSSHEPGVDAFLFLADYHALVKCEDPQRVARSRLEIAATWLAAGLDPDQVTFYRQSDIPEIPELCWMLTCVTSKGLMNRAHAYKASVDANLAKDEEADDGINMGLFSYPILMTADILMFGANRVPVGRDQIQHLEMARDIAQKFNHLYGKDLFVLPQVQIDESVATLPGLDGRKMSKSYNNTIPLFEGGAKSLKSAISQIVTDSSLPGESKDPDNSHLFTIYKAFADAKQTDKFRNELLDGMSWGDAKHSLYELIEGQIGPMREYYQELIANPEKIEEILQSGAEKARKISQPFINELRDAVGLRKMVSLQTSKTTKVEKKQSARLVSFRDDEGKFRQRLFDLDGTEVLLSEPFTNPKELHQLSQKFVGQDISKLALANEDMLELSVDGQLWAKIKNSDGAKVQAALDSL